MNDLVENTFLTKEKYEERLKEIKSWFDKEDKTGEYDELSHIEELKLLCEAKDAYIRHLEAKPNVWPDAFSEMFETSIKSAVNDSLDKIEAACVTALDKFCQQIDSSTCDEH